MRPHIFILLAVLLCSGVIVSPVLGYYTRMDIQASDANLNITKHGYEGVTSLDYINQSSVISVVNIYQKIDTTVNFTLHYGNGLSVTGYSVYSSVGIGYSKREIEIGGSYASQEFVDLMPWREDRYIISYASNKTDAGALISQGFMVHNPAIVNENILAYFPITNFHTDLITGIEITSDQPVDVYIWSDTAENTINLADFTSVSLLDNATQWINFALSIGASVLGGLLFVFGIIKFFFIDNLLLTVALWIAVTMAFSAVTSLGNGVTVKGLQRFYTTFFRYQKALFYFMVELWDYLIQILASFRGIFRI